MTPGVNVNFMWKRHFGSIIKTSLLFFRDAFRNMSGYIYWNAGDLLNTSANESERKKDKWNRCGKTLVTVEHLSDGHMEVCCTICLLLSVFTICIIKKKRKRRTSLAEKPEQQYR